MSNEGVTKEDREKLISLLKSNLRQQHRVYTSRKKYLTDEKLDALLKQIPACVSSLYEFVLPESLLKERKRQLMERAMQDQRHERKSRAEYTFELADANAYLSAANVQLKKAFDKAALTKHDEYYDLVVALQLVSGRRNYEIMKSLIVSKASHPYQATVSGICKRDSLRDYAYEPQNIPLLCPFDLFESCLVILREFQEFYGTSSQTNSFVSGRIASASKRVFGRKLTHTQKRNIYVELAYLRREEENHFLIGNQSCSKAVWVARALCHSEPGPPTTTQRYQAIVLT